jgi:hypothetical protein
LFKEHETSKGDTRTGLGGMIEHTVDELPLSLTHAAPIIRFFTKNPIGRACRLSPVFVGFGNQKGVFNEKGDNVFSQQLSLVQESQEIL